jgi:hypothetical protein
MTRIWGKLSKAVLSQGRSRGIYGRLSLGNTHASLTSDVVPFDPTTPCTKSWRTLFNFHDWLCIN